MKQQNNAVMQKLVNDTKRAAKYNKGLAADTIIEVVAFAPDGKQYIFDISFGKWLIMEKKPGVRYMPYQKGVTSYPDAIRTQYNK